MDKPQFSHSHRKLLIGSWPQLIHQHSARTAHWFDRIIILFDLKRIHGISIKVPMTRCLPETSFQHNRRRDLNISFSAMDLPPIINQQVLQDHALWQKYRQSRSFIKDRKYSKLFPQLSVISCFCLFNHMQIFI